MIRPKTDCRTDSLPTHHRSSTIVVSEIETVTSVTPFSEPLPLRRRTAHALHRTLSGQCLFRLILSYLTIYRSDFLFDPSPCLFSEFNHHRDSSGRCVLFPSATALHPLSSEEEQCRTSTDGSWYERTAYRRIPYSSCQGGVRPDRGPRHDCPNVYIGDKKSGLFWWTMAIIPFAFAGLMGMWWKKRQEAGCVASRSNLLFAAADSHHAGLSLPLSLDPYDWGIVAASEAPHQDRVLSKSSPLSLTSLSAQLERCSLGLKITGPSCHSSTSLDRERVTVL